MTFRMWIRAQRGREDSVGDLANDIKRDGTFPKSIASVRVLIEYLDSKGAHPLAIDAAERAWGEYSREVRP